MDAKGEAFWNWLKENGVEVNEKVALHDYSSEGQGRGVIALENIDKDELLFSIPRNFVLSVDNDEDYSKLVSNENDSGSWLNLMTYMMVCANRPHWKPYFDVLPTTFNTPMFWDQAKARALLQGSELLDKIGKEETEEQWAELEALFENPVFKDCDTSVEAFHRMGSLIMSYSFDIKPKTASNVDNDDEEEEEEEATKAMVPPADMLNAHTRLCNAHLFHTDDAKTIEMRSIKKIAKGEQVYNTYGELPNSDLMRRYGYVEGGGTEFDVAEVSTQLIVNTIKAHGRLDANKLDNLVAEIEQEGEFYDDAFDIGLEGELDESGVITLEYLLHAGEIGKKPSSKDKLKHECAKLAENERLSDSGRLIWLKVIDARLNQYDAKIVAEARQNPQPEQTDAVITEPEEMSKEILLGEVRILLRSKAWAEGIKTVTSQDLLDKIAKPPLKKRRV